MSSPQTKSRKQRRAPRRGGFRRPVQIPAVRAQQDYMLALFMVMDAVGGRVVVPESSVVRARTATLLITITPTEHGTVLELKDTTAAPEPAAPAASA